jgi:hypothetical protein
LYLLISLYLCILLFLFKLLLYTFSFPWLSILYFINFSLLSCYFVNFNSTSYFVRLQFSIVPYLSILTPLSKTSCQFIYFILFILYILHALPLNNFLFHWISLRRFTIRYLLILRRFTLTLNFLSSWSEIQGLTVLFRQLR